MLKIQNLVKDFGGGRRSSRADQGAVSKGCPGCIVENIIVGMAARKTERSRE